MKSLSLFVFLFLNISVYPGGGLNFQSSFGHRNHFEIVPFTWALSGQITFNIKKWAIPLTGSYSNKIFSYTHPFNKIGFSPTYKWAKFQAGYCSMTWSPFLLSGESFLGGSFELSPGAWKFSAFHGKFRKEDFGSGVLVGYAKKGFSLTVSGVRLKNNLAAVFTTTIPIYQGLTLKLEQGISTFPGQSATYASKAGISWKVKRMNALLDYQRIDPYYSTPGASFISNDEQSLQLKLQGNINSKINVGYAAVGLQKGISRKRVQSSDRITQSLSVSYKGKKGLGMQFNLTNSITHSYRNQETTSETIILINSSVSAKFSYQVPKKSSSVNTSLSILHNEGKGHENTRTSQQSAQFSFSYKKKAMTQVNTNVNRTQTKSTEIIRLSSGISHARKIKKLNYSISGLVNYPEVKEKGGIFRLQEKVVVGYVIGKKPSFTMGVNLTFTQALGSTRSKNDHQMQGQLTLSTSF